MINRFQAKELISDTLRQLNMFSDNAVNLLMGTMAQESDFGTYIKELKGGSGLSFFRIAPEQHDSVVLYLSKRDMLHNMVKIVSTVPECRQWLLLYNLKYAICIAAIYYRMQDEPIPDTLDGLAKYWDEYWNTGSGTISQFIFNYKKFVL